MKINICILGLMFSVLFNTTVNAQFLDKIKAKFSNKEKTEESSEQDEKQNRQMQEMLMNMLGGTNVDLPKSYTFDYQISYEFTNNEDVSHLDYMVSEDGDYFGFKAVDYQNILVVLDQERKVTVMYQEDENGNKTGYKLPNMLNDKLLQKKESEDKNVTIKKTGITKDIIGYSCSEYIATSEEGVANIWITPAVKNKEEFIDEKLKAEMLIVSQSNYRALITHKSLDNYRVFFNAIYLNGR